MRAAQQDLLFEPPSRRVHPDGLIRAKECAAAGLCIFCEEPVGDCGAGRKRIVCRKRGCYRAYHRAYGRDRRRQPFELVTGQLTRTFERIAKNIAALEQLGNAPPGAPKETA